MATSGSVDYSIDRSGLISAAYKLCGVVEEGGTANTNQLADGVIILNLLIKNWMVHGPTLWTTEEIVLFPIKDRVVYRLGGASTDRMTLSSDFISSTVSANEASGQTIISTTSTTGMAASDVVGVETDDGGIHWTTISGAPTSTTITLASALTTTAGAGNRIYTYTTAFTQVPKRLIAQWLSDENYITRPVQRISKDEYSLLSAKTSDGIVTQMLFDPQLLESLISVWQVPTDGDLNNVMYLYIQRIVEDFDGATDTPDLPQEWYLPLVLNLAYHIAPSLGVPAETYARIRDQALVLKKEALDFDTDQTSLYHQPEVTYEEA